MKQDSIMQNSINPIPQHVSIIMDGNGRWARSRGLDRTAGHAEGAESVRAVLAQAAAAGVKYLSLYAFSEENWNRSPQEVDALMTLMMDCMVREIDELDRSGVRFMVLGNTERLSENLRRVIDDCMKRTASNTGITMILMFSYSGKWDILQAARKIALGAAREGEQFAQNLSMDDFGGALVTALIPDPDLIIRTSGETRLSNYFLWQAAYSEFYFTPVLWPDFKGPQFMEALESYSKRDRRYGKTK